MYLVTYFFARKPKHLAWFIPQRVSQLTRLITNTSVMPSIILAYLGIVASYFIDAPYFSIIDATDKIPPKSLLESIIGEEISIYFLLIIALIITLGGRYFFVSQTPKSYARHSVEGVPFSRSVTYISYCIWKEMHFWKSLSFIKKMLSKIVEIDGSEFDGDKSVISKNKISVACIPMVRKITDKRGVKVERIRHMIIHVSNTMGVPPHRICDALFQFSPNIYTSEYRSASKKLTEIVNTLKIDGKGAERRKKYAQDVLKFFENKKKRATYQIQIIDNRDLHNVLIDISMGFGISNALSSYCMGLTKIANTKPRKSTIYLTKKLKFLYYKRNLYPGIDLHLIAARLAQISENQKDLFESLEKLMKLKTHSNTEELKNWFGIYGKKLGGLTAALDQETFKQRSIIDEKFIQFMFSEMTNFLIEKSSSEDRYPKVILLTQGYSSVVNRSLQRLAIEISNFYKFKNYGAFKKFVDDYHNDTSKGQTENQEIRFTLLERENTDSKKLLLEFGQKVLSKMNKVEIHYYVLVSPDQIDDEHLTVSRYTRFNFKETPNVSSLSSGLIKVKLGSIEWFVNRFWNEKNTIYRVAGAEFIQVRDKDGNACPVEQEPAEYRMINNEGYYDLDSMASKILRSKRKTEENTELGKQNAPKIKNVILAETFKHFDHPLSKPFDQILNQDQFEYLQFHQWSEDAKIITGAGEHEELPG